MTKFEAEYKKQYSHMGDELVTAKEKISYAINDDWYYSMHWKDDTWVEQAKRDLKKRQIRVSKEHENLKLAETLLKDIEVY